MRTAAVTCLAVMVVLGLAAPFARADVAYEVKLPDAAHPDAAPTVEVTVVGGPRLPQDKYTLRDADAHSPIELHASAKRDYAHGSETVALAIVLDTWEMWVGNDDVIRDDDPDLARLASRTSGILKPLEQALDAVKFGDAAPPGSVAFVVTYGDRAAVRVPVEPLATLTGAQLGSQHDYFGTKGGELVHGVELALARLHDLTAARKLLVVIGDGHDTNDDAARAALRTAKALAAQDRVQTFAILYKAPLSDANGPGNAIAALTANTTTVNTADNIASSIASILSRLDDRYYLTFPGWDAARGVGLAWDAAPHHLVLAIDKEDQDAGDVVLAPAWSPRRGHPAWTLVLGGGAGAVLFGAIATVIGIVVVRRRSARGARVDAGGAVASAAVAVKTVMIGAGGDRDGFPVVGWLVPLNGQTAYQTFRLRAGVTQIGTGRVGSDIVIDDGFMSTRHCEIAASPCGFLLQDAGSTNGSYVNDHRVDRHELVDNDLVTLGKTCFRFKSIS